MPSHALYLLLRLFPMQPGCESLMLLSTTQKNNSNRRDELVLPWVLCQEKLTGENTTTEALYRMDHCH